MKLCSTWSRIGGSSACLKDAAPLPVREKVPFVDRQHLCKEYVYSVGDKCQTSNMDAFLSEFDFEVNHIKGKEKRVADALNRRDHKVYEITMSQPESDLMRRIKTTNIHDLEYENLLNKLLKDEVNLNGIEFKVD